MQQRSKVREPPEPPAAPLHKLAQELGNLHELLRGHLGGRFLRGSTAPANSGQRLDGSGREWVAPGRGEDRPAARRKPARRPAQLASVLTGVRPGAQSRPGGRGAHRHAREEDGPRPGRHDRPSRLHPAGRALEGRRRSTFASLTASITRSVRLDFAGKRILRRLRRSDVVSKADGAEAPGNIRHHSLRTNRTGAPSLHPVPTCAWG